MATANQESAVFNVDIVEQNGSQLTVPVALIYTEIFNCVLKSWEKLQLGYPVEISQYPNKAVILKTSPKMGPNIHLVNLEVQREEHCLRCKSKFLIENVETYVKPEGCRYHLQKLNWDRNSFLCCNNDSGSNGCANSRLHIWSGICEGLNGPFEDYVRTRPPTEVPKNGNYGIFALDCQMCNTTAGFNIIEVTLVDVYQNEIYHAYVKPLNDVIDYNTQFSGIKRRWFSQKKLKTLENVQSDLMTYINCCSHIIGQGLENKLRGLKILHDNITDTSLLFPRDPNYPHGRRSLKDLSVNILNRPLAENGRKSLNNAKTVMDLALFKVKCNLTAKYYTSVP